MVCNCPQIRKRIVLIASLVTLEGEAADIGAEANEDGADEDTNLLTR
jgi:hypothetical protein